jgi:flagellar hook-associated protein 2
VSLDGGAPRTSLILTKGLVSTPIDVGDGSLAATVAAINKEKAGVTASMVQMVAATDSAPAQYRLQLTSTTTGANSAVSLKAADGVLLVPTVAVAGQDAEIDLGGGTLIARSSNTISDVMEGVTLTLSKADAQTGGVFTGPPVTVSVKKDADGIASKVQALVDAANAARNDAKSLTAMDPVSKVKGRLYGDSMVRGLVDEVRSTVPDALGKVAQAGRHGGPLRRHQLRQGDLPEGVGGRPCRRRGRPRQERHGRPHAHPGRHGLARPAADGGPGRISSAITSKESQISSLKSNVESWDSRLAMKEKQLQRQYTSLETALGKAQSQGAWLSSQLANLPKWS